MPQALPNPEHFAEIIKKQYNDKSMEVIETIRYFGVNHFDLDKDGINFIETYIEQVKQYLNEKRD